MTWLRVAVVALAGLCVSGILLALGIRWLFNEITP